MVIYNVTLVTNYDGSKSFIREQKFEAKVGKKTYIIMDGKRRISFDDIGRIDTKIYDFSPSVQYSMWVLDPDDAHEPLITHTENVIHEYLEKWRNKLYSFEMGMDDGFDIQKIDGDARYSLTDEQMKRLNDKILNNKMF